MGKQQILLESALTAADRMPTLMDLAAAHVASRGTAASLEDADLVLGLDDLERIMTDFGYQ